MSFRHDNETMIARFDTNDGCRNRNQAATATIRLRDGYGCKTVAYRLHTGCQMTAKLDAGDRKPLDGD